MACLFQWRACEKALTLFFASLTVANPLYNKPNIIGRQDAGMTTSVAAPVADSMSTAGASASVTAMPSASLVAGQTDVNRTLSGTSRTCSLLYETAFTTTAYMTMESTTSAMYTISLNPNLGCICNDGLAAGIDTSYGSDGLGTITCQIDDGQIHAIATQTSAMVPNPTYVAEWCETIDTNDPVQLIELWEDKNVSVVMDYWTNGKGDGWLKALVEHALPNKGDVGYGGCGVIGGSCNLGLDCPSMVRAGLGPEYWILKAVEGFHDKLDVVHEFLQDTTIDNILSLGTIARDFSAPKSNGLNALSIIASVVSAGIFLGGGVAGALSAISTEVKTASAAAKARYESQARSAITGNDVERANTFDKLAAAAERQEKLNEGISRTGNALGAGLWLTASAFTAVSAFSDPEDQVESEDLEPLLQSMFSAARDQLVALGNLAMGRGGDYSSLPTAPGTSLSSTVLDPESYIAGFFSDGKFLLAESNPEYNASIHDSYGTFKSKIVDQALQTGGLKVFALTDLGTKEDCYDETLWGGYGAQWMDPLEDGNMYCMQLYRDSNDGPCGDALTTCDWIPAEKEVFDKLQSSYGFNMAKYYSAAVQCNKAGLKDNIPDFIKMQHDEITPACYYNIPAQKAKKKNQCISRDNIFCNSGFELSDF